MHSAAQHERGASAGLRPAPAEAFKPRKQQQQRRATELGGAVWASRTRRRPIHGGSMAPSMAPTVLPAHTAPPLTVSRDLVDPRRARMDVPTDFEIIDWISSMHGMDPRVDQGRHPPGPRHAIPTNRGNLSKAGWVRLRGRERHGWRDRAYMDVLAASPATGPTPPSRRKPAVAVAVAVLLPWPEGLCGCRAQPGRPTPSAHVNAYSIFPRRVICTTRRCHIAQQHASARWPC
ncbi:MAG: hypothetical protein K0R79_597 [Stenotrophomonas indicatrix]|jgi:hypothetical protein|nr:hypothetical protein [Stenotrophomonas indicatrix]